MRDFTGGVVGRCFRFSARMKAEEFSCKANERSIEGDEAYVLCCFWPPLVFLIAIVVECDVMRMECECLKRAKERRQRFNGRQRVSHR